MRRLREELREQLYFPDHASADRSTFREAWLCTLETADLNFSSGITMSLAPVEDPDIDGFWRHYWNSDPAHFHRGKVGGATASIFDRSTDGASGGSVSWVVDGLMLVISSESHVINDLLSVAETVSRIE